MLHDLCGGVEQVIEKRTQVRALHQANAGRDESVLTIKRKKWRTMDVQVTADFMVIGWINVEFSKSDLRIMRHLVGERCAHLVVVPIPCRPAVDHRERILTQRSPRTFRGSIAVTTY